MRREEMGMTSDMVDLYFERETVDGKERELEAALRRLPGIQTVELLGSDAETIEARVRVGFDPARVNPVMMEDALDRAGFAILSAGERPQPRG
jgi:hypothetical protein